MNRGILSWIRIKKIYQLKNKKYLLMGVIILAGLFLLAGCGKKAAEKGESAANGEQNASGEEYVYVSDFQEITGSENESVRNTYLTDDALYYVMMASTSTDGGNTFNSRLCKRTFADQKTEDLLALEEGIDINGITSGKEAGTLLLLISDGTEVTNKSYFLMTVGADGTEQNRVDISSYFTGKENLYFTKILSDEEGNCYLLTDMTIYAVDPGGALLAEIGAGTYISSLMKIKDGSILAGYFTNTGWMLEKVDLAGKKLMPVQSSIPFDYGSYQSGSDKDLLYTVGNNLYTCNLTDGETTPILDWIQSDVDSNMLQNYRILPDGMIAAISQDYNEKVAKCELVLLKKTLKSEAPQKTILTYGTYRIPYYTNKDIVAFNKQSDQYRIEVKDYQSGETDYETAYNQLTMEIASGKGPDMLDLGFASDINNLTKQGVLEDLNPYFEKSTVLKKEDFLSNILGLYEADGKQVGILTNFALDAFAGKKSVIGDRSGWTVDEMMEFVKAREPGTEIFPYANKGAMFYALLQMSMQDFVNTETGKCDVSGEEFLKIMEFCNEFPEQADYSTNQDGYMQKIRSGELLLEQTTLSSVQLYQMYEVGIGEPVTFIGYPSSNGGSMQIRPNGMTVGINAQSSNKDGCFTVIEYLLAKEQQDKNSSANGGFPVMKSSLEERFATEMEKEYYIDADGTEKEEPKGYWSNGEVSTPVYAATEEQVNAVRTMIEKTKPAEAIDPEIYNIIMEEVSPYFSGQKKASDVVGLIQNRVQTYLNENS